MVVFNGFFKVLNTNSVDKIKKNIQNSNIQNLAMTVAMVLIMVANMVVMMALVIVAVMGDAVYIGYILLWQPLVHSIVPM